MNPADELKVLRRLTPGIELLSLASKRWLAEYLHDKIRADERAFRDLICEDEDTTPDIDPTPTPPADTVVDVPAATDGASPLQPRLAVAD